MNIERLSLARKLDKSFSRRKDRTIQDEAIGRFFFHISYPSTLFSPFFPPFKFSFTFLMCHENVIKELVFLTYQFDNRRYLRIKWFMKIFSTQCQRPYGNIMAKSYLHTTFVASYSFPTIRVYSSNRAFKN